MHLSLSRRAAVVLLACLAYVPCANAATLVARVDKTDVVLGGAVALELTSVAPEDARPLDALTLDALSADFEVLDVSRGTRSRAGQTTQSLTATLYPRRVGRLRIPAWSIPNAYSMPIDITVRESGPDRARVLIRAGIEPQQPHVRAGAELYLDVYDSNDFTWMPPEPVAAPGLHLRALAEAKRIDMLDGKSINVTRYRWAAIALREGAIEVAFESLRARKFGQRLRYGVDPFRFTAQPVPAWLPVYVPIGAPEVRVDPLPAEWPVGRPVNWSFRITGSGLSANGVKQLLAATLEKGDAVQWYAPQVELVDEALARSPQQSFQVAIPVQALEHGAVQLPPLRVPYFDAQHARLEAVEIPGAQITAISAAHVLAWRVIAVVLLLLLAAAILRYAVAAWRRMRRRRQMFARIDSAQDARAIRSAVLHFAAANDGRLYPTLRRWQPFGERCDESLQWVAQIERACYSPHADDFAVLKRTASSALRKRPS